ncbi:MAG: nitroreductase family protein [Actinobacteria bacterium]|nr:nitroreductase family protein [Actinomycetota bacterium]
MIQIDENRCDHCGLCTMVCPYDLVGEGPRVKGVAKNLCVECGHCFAVCPREAITLPGFEDIEINPVDRDDKIDRARVKAMFKGRRSGRNYRNVPVTREDMEEIIEAASCSPSASNARPVKAYVCRNPETINQIRKRMRTLYNMMYRAMKIPGLSLIIGRVEMFEIMRYALEDVLLSDSGRDMVLYRAPTLLAFSVPSLNPMSAGDAWLAAENAVIYADSIGVSSCFMGFFGILANFDPVMRKLIGIPRGESIKVGLIMGYPKVKYSREAPRRTMQIHWDS